MRLESRTISCQEYINDIPEQLIGTNNPGCYNDVTYIFNIRNVGTGCGMINDVQTTVEGKVVTLETDSWNQERRRFCRNELLTLRRPEANVNMCSLAGAEVGLGVKINTAQSEIAITFSKPDNVPTATPPKSCSHDPEKLIFLFTGDTCNRSVNNQKRQRKRHARQLRRLSRSKGKGSDKNPAPVRPPFPAPAPFPAQPDVSPPDKVDKLFTCEDFLLLRASSAKITVTNLDATLLLFDGTVTEGTSFSIGDPKHLIPDDIRMNVYDDRGALVQTVKLHSSCSTEMNLGETFGAFKLVGFMNKDGSSSL